MQSASLSTSQPQSLVDAVKAAAERQGVTVSVWVGAACLGALQPQEKETVADRAPVGFPVGKKKTVNEKKRLQVKRKAVKRSKVLRPISDAK